MSISLDDIKTAVRKGYADGRFSLQLSSLQSKTVDTVAADYFPQSALTLANCQPFADTDAGNSITVQGVGVDAPFAGLSVSVRFYITDGQAAFAINSTIYQGWSFEKSFPMLAGTVITGFAWASSPTFQLTTAADATLVFEGSLDLEKGVGGLAGLFGLKEQKLSGQITLKEGGTSLRTVELDAPVSEQVDLKIATVEQLTFKLGSYLYYDFIERRYAAVPFVGLSAHLPFVAQGKKYTIPISAEIADLGQDFRFDADLTDAVDAGLHELSSLTQGVGFGEFIPKDFHLEDILRISDLSFDFNPTAASKLTSVSLSVNSANPWIIYHLDASNKDLVIANVKLSLVVSNPLAKNATEKVVFAMLGGEMSLGNAGTLVLSAHYPNFLVQGYLKEGTKLELGEIIADFIGPAAQVPKLEFINLSFDLGGGQYSIAGEVDGVWAVGPLALLSMNFAVSRDSGGIQASIDGLLSIGNVTVLLSAAHEKEAKGWGFSGSTAPESEIRLGTLIDQLAQSFTSTATQQLPDFLTSLVITALAVTFDTGNENFSFKCTLDFNADGTKVEMSIVIDLKKSDGNYKQIYGGTLQVGAVEFALVFEKVKPASPGEQAQPATFFLAAVEPKVKIGLRDLVARINEGSSQLMPDLSIDIKELLFAYEKQGTSSPDYVFGSALGFEIELSTLPLVGRIISDGQDSGIKDVQLLFASAPIALSSVDTYNALLTEVKIEPLLPTGKSGADGNPTQPSAPVLGKGFNIAAKLQLGGQTTPVGAGGSTAPVSGGATPPPTTTPTAPAGDASWFDVDKSVGPVTLRRAGVRYQDGRIWLLLDADLRLALLSFGLQGLGLGFDPRDATSIRADLAGMSLAYNSGPLEIQGGFLNFEGDYLGEAVVKAGQFSLTALGGLAAKDSSFFIFVRLDSPLGGPPFFFVTGLAGGIGVNRSLDIPKIDELASFALLPQNKPFPATLDSKNPREMLAGVLSATEKYIRPETGEYWLAAGIDFTSFQMVDVSALITVAFGVNLNIALLGICRITVPKLDPEPVLFLEITLEAQFEPAAGLIAIDGRITPASFLFAGAVRITGGFSFYIWYAGEYAGDFVVSVGGYHPRFTKPDNYPAVPRLELNFSEGPLVMKGQAYMALVPHMLMGGLAIRITWSSGAISAWLDAGLNFLLAWRPFHYEADASIEIGASLDVDLLFVSVRITIHVGALLTIWGPPFGGKATVDLDIVSFTINFGDNPRHELVSWEEFKQSFLPTAKPAKTLSLAAGLQASGISDNADTHLCTASVTGGLLQQPKAKDETEFFSWLVDPNHFVIASNVLIPAKTALFNDFSLNNPFGANQPFTHEGSGTPTAVPVANVDTVANPSGINWTTGFGVLPVGLGNEFDSAHAVSVYKLADGEDYTDPSKYSDKINNLSIGPILANAQQALWGMSQPGLNDKRLIDGTLAGLALSPLIQHPETTLNADLWSLLFDQNQTIGWYENVADIPTTDSFAAHATNDRLSFTQGGKILTLADYKLGEAMTAEPVTKARAAIISSLQSLGLDLDQTGSEASRLADYALWDWPVIESLGEQKAAA